MVAITAAYWSISFLPMLADARRPFLWMTLFYMAMAFLESAVVVYLRALYYPDGFAFPLVPMDASLVVTELIREIATMIMLLAPAALLTRSVLERFAWFCFGFGVWDLFYYIWLKVLLDWPAALDEMDLLFLVPVPWVGPVWAPCTISLGLIAFAVIVLDRRRYSPAYRVDRSSWALLIAGAALMILSFTLDPLSQRFGLQVLSSGTKGSMPSFAATSYVPQHYPWPWFAAGAGLSLLGLVRCWRMSDVVGGATVENR